MYDVTIEVGTGGVISPDKSFTMKHGESKTFDILPDDGYTIKSIIVNDVDKTNDVVDGKFTLSNVTEDIVITVEFEKLVVDTDYVITIKVGNGGVISPDNSFTIKHGESKTFDILPDDGYKIKSIIVNGIDKTNDVVDGKLTLSNITEDIILTVEFEKLADTSKETVANTDNIENPKTYDNVLFYVGLVLVSIIGLTLSRHFKKIYNQ